MPRRLRLRDDVLAIASVAASFAVAVGLALNVGEFGSDSSRGSQSARPAYLDSPGYDLSIIKRAQDTRDARRIMRAV